MRRIDWSRSYGSISPPINGAVFVQDNILYDIKGMSTEDIPDAPEEVQEVSEEPPPTGAVLLSEAKLPGALQVSARSHWQTTDWPKLRKALKNTYGYWPANREDALFFLDGKKLISKEA